MFSAASSSVVCSDALIRDLPLFQKTDEYFNYVPITDTVLILYLPTVV